MSRKFGVVVLSRYDARLEAFLSNLFEMEPTWARNCEIVVGDDGLSEACASKYRGMGIQVLHMPKPFNFARNVNLAVEALDRDCDILIANDDITFESPAFFSVFSDLLDSQPRDIDSGPYAAIAPAVIRGEVGNGYQCFNWMPGEPWSVRPLGLICFVAVVISRQAWDVVGILDEDFVGYGYEDNDWCRRATLAGFRLGVTPLAKIAHGFRGSDSSTSFKEVFSNEELLQISKDNLARFTRKWGDILKVHPITLAPLPTEKS